MAITTHFPRNQNNQLSRIIRAVFSRGLYNGQWSLRILIGRGAGYCTWILGRRVAIPHWTIYIARHCYDPRTINTGRAILPWQFGITCNGNRAPYVNG